MEGFTDNALEQALIGWAKLLKNVSYYPDGHPALNTAIHQSVDLLRTVLARNDAPLVLTVKRRQFLIDNHPLISNNPLPPDVANRLFAHKIKTLTFLPDLVDRHLLSLCRIITSEPATVVIEGGVQELLERQQVTTIWTNELDLGAINKRREALEQKHNGASPGKEESSPEQNGQPGQLLESSEASLQQVLDKLQEILLAPAKDKEMPFLHALRQLTQSLQRLMGEGHHQQALQILKQLDVWIQSPQTDARYVRVLRQAVASLIGHPLVDLLIDNAKTRQEQHFVTRIIMDLPAEQVGSLLIQRLSEELDNKLRRFLSQLLVAMGAKVFPLLIDSLSDERWFVTRNAITILSESRDPELTEQFIPYLDHPDGRVAKEAIRALARIKTEQASQALIAKLESKDYEFPNQIILALGAQADPAAVPPLVKIARQRDPFLNQKNQVRDAILALSEIASPDCSQALIDLVERGKLVKRKEYNEIRCQAAAAMGNLSDPESLAALQRASDSSNQKLASTARQALRQRSES
ncbi:HEAT repeat-containing protein [Desulfuromonas acetoxidans]|uniref:PBS lyase HEAT-like repeat n=1 Tax=Desulfuromonas acetoxidans (strain DSM 684 / 11070) TaxID=281689 RepID=Q1K4D8_DESA6|nr:HEAT repeat-containing protein [Desulfuromonas acetoxidans]EAT17165.1 PBS lyase HEAT-like repeat [Desulfuromonas acetoxidans DSM 684]MBF0646323.1 HEAT repeat-containing protein [Desulfuromonas acetoxidans]NVD24248.1 HEAT repeat-containing protein [Desulfuromonas acetoxidans]NVE14979.1 HEAT repeat-containing protein [Desulfuromonas acetoxidans]